MAGKAGVGLVWPSVTKFEAMAPRGQRYDTGQRQFVHLQQEDENPISLLGYCEQ